MRLRNVTGAIDHINQHPLVNQEPTTYKGKWNSFFGNENPIYIEIGMGKGDFVIENAKTYPDINFIGIEKFSAVLLRGVQKVEELKEELPNLCLLRFDAFDLLEIFDENEVARVYLNFSDPWPKDKWIKRRLMCKKFLDKYKEVLPVNGLVRFKTDNDPLFEFSLEEVAETAFKTNKMTRDLHHSEYLEGNIMTEYEAKFVGEGKSINFIEISNVK